jgi:uncharacterized small protein (DUF1192 family)
MLARVERCLQLELNRRQIPTVKVFGGPAVAGPVKLPLAVGIGMGRQWRWNEARHNQRGGGPVVEANQSQSRIRQATLWARRATMNSTLSLAELDDRIAILRDNLRQLVEQAAAASGSQNEERIADRITQQTEELDRLILERDSRATK